MRSRQTGTGGPITSLLALTGGLGTTAVIFVLAWRKGITGFRLVLIGIGITAMLTSLTQYLLTRAELFEAQRAVVWLAGSLNGRDRSDVHLMAWTLAVRAPCVLALGRHLRTLGLGDDLATGLGARVHTVRTALVGLAVVLAAFATAADGPIAFVALVARQIACRLTGSRTLAMVPSMILGALTVVASDLAGRRIFAPTILPVGVVTAVIGAPFLLHLLALANTSERAG